MSSSLKKVTEFRLTKHIENLDYGYLLQLDPDRLLSWFRREVGLITKAPPYPSWEPEPVSSVGALPGHILAERSCNWASSNCSVRRRART